MAEESVYQSPMKTIQPTMDESIPSINIPSPEKMINRIIEENASTSKKQPTLLRKKLKRRSQLLIERKVAKKISKRYFDEEAELGSDNEEHDDIIKEIKGSDNEDDDEENNKDIENLINDTDIIDDGENNHKEKFIEDEMLLDKERIKKVIEGPKERQLNKKRRRDYEEDMNDLPLHVRIERMNNENQHQDKEEEFKSLLFRYKKFQHDMNDEENGSGNEEMKAYFQAYKTSTIRKLNIMSGQHDKELRQRMKEDNEILKNVVMLNKQHKNDKAANKPKPSSLPMKSFSSYMTPNNSFLLSMRKNKEENQQQGTEAKKEIERGSFLSGTNGLYKNNYQVNASTLTVRGGCLMSLFVKKQ